MFDIRLYDIFYKLCLGHKYCIICHKCSQYKYAQFSMPAVDFHVNCNCVSTGVAVIGVTFSLVAVFQMAVVDIILHFT